MAAAVPVIKFIHVFFMSFKNTIHYFECLLFNMWCEVEATNKLSCLNEN